VQKYDVCLLVIQNLLWNPKAAVTLSQNITGEKFLFHETLSAKSCVKSRAELYLSDFVCFAQNKLKKSTSICFRFSFGAPSSQDHLRPD